jgi:hypothetical protein
MNARESENYLAISRSSSASKSVEILWAEMLRRSSLVECVTCVYNASNFFYPSVCADMFIKKSQVHILYHKEVADARILYI